MNFLILINSAPKLGHYHFALGQTLKEQGHVVEYALTCYLPVFSENLHLENEKFYVFSDYLNENFENKKISEKYKKIDINKLFFSDFDRFVVHEKSLSMREKHFDSLAANLISFYDNIFKQQKFDAILNEAISSSFSYAAYEVGKVNNVPYCGYAGSRLKDRFELYTEEFGSIEEFSNAFKNTILAKSPVEALEFAHQYLKQYDNTLPSYHPTDKIYNWRLSFMGKYLDIKYIRLLWRYTKYSFSNRKRVKITYHEAKYPVISLLIAGCKSFRKKIKQTVSRKYFSKVDYSEKFFLFPQHFKPEASTSVSARYYCNDLSVIQNIAFSLPFGTRLYVKEHFVNFGRLDLSYYRALTKIPNVKLIFCDEDTRQLIKHCQAVITLTSTMGFEALMMNKPVFVLGNVFYECHPNCRKIHEFPMLANELKNLEINTDPEINKKFISAYYLHTYPGNLYYFLGKSFPERNFCDPYISAIAKKHPFEKRT